MQRVSSPTAVAALPAVVTGGTPGFYAQYTPGIGVPTILTPDWANGVQEEVMAIVESTGQTPGLSTLTQMRDGVMALGYFTDTGAANAYAIATAVTIERAGVPVTIPAAQLLSGTRFNILAAHGNTGASNVAVDGTEFAWTNNAGGALVSADVVAGVIYPVVYDGTVVRMLSVTNGQIAAAITAALAGLTTTTTTITGASHAYVAGDGSKTIWRSNAGAAMIDSLPGATAGALPAGWSSTIVNADTAGLLAVQVGAGSTFKGPGVSNGYIVLGPGQQAKVSCDGTNYTCYGGSGRAKVSATAGATLYVSTTGSDTANTGLTAASPFATIQHAYNWAQQYLDYAGTAPAFSMAAGTYTAGLAANGLLEGQTGSVSIAGAASATTAINATGGACFAALNGAILQPAHFTLTAPIAGGAALATGGSGGADGTIYLGTDLVFGACQLAHMSVAGGRIILAANYSITSGGSAHWLAQGSGKIENANSGITVTLTGTPAFSGAFASVNSMALINPAGLVTFSGAATGARYATASGGTVNTNGSGASYLPGNAAGSGSGYY